MMYRKKLFIDIVGLCIINIFILFSKYPIEIKTITILFGILVFILCYVRRKKVILWIAIYIVLMLILNISCFSRLHLDRIKTYSNSYNMYSKWMTTQTDYTWNGGNGEVILSSIFRDKVIYVISEEKYAEYIRYFSKGLCFLENVNVSQIKFENLKENFIALGRMTPHITPWLWNDDMHEELSELRTDFETTPRIFVSSEYVADSPNLVVVSDDKYNIYIWSYEEFQEEQ